MNETSGHTFYVDQEEEDRDESDDSVNELDLSVNSWIMVKDDEEAAAAPPGAEQAEERMKEATPGCPKPEAETPPSKEEVQSNFN